MADFVKKFQETWNNEGIEYKVLKGHNHVSPIAALMSGDEIGEKWGEELAAWVIGKGGPVEVDDCAREIPRGPRKKHHDDDVVPSVTKSGEEDGGGVEKHSIGDKKTSGIDLNREDGGSQRYGAGKGESEPKEIDPKEHITPRDGA